MKSRISSKGQVTVPHEVREKLGLRPGTVVEFEVREGDAVLRKGAPRDHPVDVVYGTIKMPVSVDEALDALRGPRPDAARSRGRRRFPPRR